MTPPWSLTASTPTRQHHPVPERTEEGAGGEPAPVEPAPGPARVDVVAARLEDAAEIQRLTLAAFSPYTALDPPSGAVHETLHQVRTDLKVGGGALALLAGRPVGCLRWERTPAGDFHVRRVAVEPRLQGRGIGRALMAWAEREAAAKGSRAVTLGVRVALPGNLAFYTRLGYQVTGEHRHAGYRQTTWLSMRKVLEPPE
jgi:GNAT superfamily N-acetyltransferase